MIGRRKGECTQSRGTDIWRPRSGVRGSAAAVALATCGVLLVACDAVGPPTPEGYWEGSGTVHQIVWDMPVHSLTQGADFDFWFVVDSTNQLAGEITATYEAEYKADGLPGVEVPLPGGSFSFEPEIAGQITEPNPTRRYPIVGQLTEDRLHIASSGEVDPLEFTLRADPGISPIGLGPVSMPVHGAGGNVIAHKFDVPAFHPLGPAAVEKRPQGPFVATVNVSTDKLGVSWTARQVGGEQREIRITPRMQEVLDSLRRELAIE